MLRSVHISFIISVLALALSGCPEIDPTTLCTSDQDCFERYGCDMTGSRTCKRTCTVNSSGGSTECLASQQCDVATGADVGFCEPLADTETTASGNTTSTDG